MGRVIKTRQTEAGDKGLVARIRVSFMEGHIASGSRPRGCLKNFWVPVSMGWLIKN